MGTLAAIIIYFYDDIQRLLKSAVKGQKNDLMYIIQLVIASIPAMCTG